MIAMEIINQVAEKYGVPPSVLRSGDPAFRYSMVKARRETYIRLRHERNLSYGQIGRMMGGRDGHSVYNVLSRNRKSKRARPSEAQAWAIIKETAVNAGVSAAELCGYAKPYLLFDARRAVCNRLRFELGMSLAQVGRLMGGRDHTTVLSATNDKVRARNLMSARKRSRKQLTEGGHGARDARPVTATDSAVAAHG